MTKAEKAALQEEKGKWLEEQNSYWRLEHEKLQEEKNEFGQAKTSWEEDREKQLRADWAKLNEEREQVGTERDLWHEERARLKNIDLFKLQVERDKLSEEKEAFQIERNIHGFTTASDILELRVESRQKVKKSAMKPTHFDEPTFGHEFSPMRRPKAGLSMGAGGKPRDRYELVQDMFERPIHDAFVSQSGNERFFKNLKENQLDFKRLLYKGHFKFGQDFRIRRVKELFEIEYGKDYKQKGEVGRVCVISHKGEKEQQFLYEGELKMRADGLHCIDGYGRYVYQDQCAVGQFRNHNLHGEAKVIRSCGTVREGIFHQNVMHGPGRVTQTDGTVLEGDFYHGKLSGLGMITKNDGKVIEG